VTFFVLFHSHDPTGAWSSLSCVCPSAAAVEGVKYLFVLYKKGNYLLAHICLLDQNSHLRNFSARCYEPLEFVEARVLEADELSPGIGLVYFA